MRFLSDFNKGVLSHLRAFEFIARHKLWAYFLYPAILATLLTAGGFWSAFGLGNYLADRITDQLPEEISSGYEWMNTIVNWILWIVKLAAGFILWLFIFLLFMKYIRYFVLIFCSPVMALLSERVDEIVSGKIFPFQFGRFLKDVLRGIFVTFRNIFLETMITIGLLIIGWIPVFGWITVPLLWLAGWYFLGFSMMDYTYERRKWGIAQGAIFTRRRKGIAMGNGMIFSFILVIPFVGLILAPVLSVVAGTLATLEALDEIK
ncbi:MAG TPA: EI24 domain-containing protein [Bacteroidia bacterium]|nr:EI24 domain-containing protein [Bacteroidia bacterium]